MLYLTTRRKNDTHTAAVALSNDRGPDGGFYVPLKLPRLDQRQIRKLGENSFSQNVAEVINLFFGTKLDGWAIEFAIGRYPVKIHSIGSRELVAETWHNPVWKFERLAKGIEKGSAQDLPQFAEKSRCGTDNCRGRACRRADICQLYR